MKKTLIISLVFLFTFFFYNIINVPSNSVKAGICRDIQKNLQSDDLESNSTHLKCKKKDLIIEETLEGTLVEKNDDFFMIDTKEGLLSGEYPTNFPASDIQTGSKIKVYYTGVILEIYPGQIQTVTKIERID